MRRSVLITGASSGIGAATARVLAARGFRVWAGVRDENGAPSGTTPIRLDITDGEQIGAAAQRIAADGGLYALINNAGIAVSAPLESVPLDALREQFEVNVFGTLAVTQAMIPLLRRSLGRLVMISSIAGRNAAAFIGPYAASKHALEALSDALRAELAPSGIEVSLIEPGAVRTPIWERGAVRGIALADAMEPVLRARYDADVSLLLRASAALGAHGLEPERVARAVARAFIARRPKTRYVVGTEAHVQLAARRFVPDRLRDRLIRAALRRAAR
jgi:NAD(P)-dependent dehydrogenase (short-subunit alcohol dehydrogenase family)